MQERKIIHTDIEMFDFVKQFNINRKEKKFEKETKSTIDDILSTNNEHDIRHIPFKVEYGDCIRSNNFFDKIKEIGEAYSNSRLVITPTLNLTDKQCGPKVIGIKIRWKF